MFLLHVSAVCAGASNLTTWWVDESFHLQGCITPSVSRLCSCCSSAGFDVVNLKRPPNFLGQKTITGLFVAFTFLKSIKHFQLLHRALHI